MAIVNGLDTNSQSDRDKLRNQGYYIDNSGVYAPGAGSRVGDTFSGTQSAKNEAPSPSQLPVVNGTPVSPSSGFTGEQTPAIMYRGDPQYDQYFGAGTPGYSSRNPDYNSGPLPSGQGTLAGLMQQILQGIQQQAQTNRQAQLKQQQQQQVSNVLGGNANAAGALSRQLVQPYYAPPSNYGFYGAYSGIGNGYGGQSYLGSGQQPSFLDTLLSGLFGSMFSSTPSGSANASVSPPAAPGSPAANGYLDTSQIQPYIQNAQNVGQQLNASPAAQQQVGGYTFQPIGAQDSQPKRQIPGNLFQIPSTQMYSNFSPSEQTGLFTFGQGLGISNQDLVSQILGGAPPGGGSTQSFLRNSMRPFGLPY